MQFKGKTVLVTGGASGIGLATCRGFAEAGAQVIMSDVNAERGDRGRRGASKGRRSGRSFSRWTSPIGRASRPSPPKVKCGSGSARRARQRRRLGHHPAVHGQHARSTGKRSSRSTSWARSRSRARLLPLLFESGSGPHRQRQQRRRSRRQLTARPSTPVPRAASSRSPSRWPAKWCASRFASTASARGRPTRRCSRHNPRRCARR